MLRRSRRGCGACSSSATDGSHPADSCGCGQKSASPPLRADRHARAFQARGEAMPGSVLGFVAGSCVLLLLPHLPDPGLLVGLALLAAAAGCWLRSGAPLAFVAGLVLCAFASRARLDDRITPELEGRTLAIEGRVASVPQAVAQGLRFRFEPTRGPAALPHTLELTWYEPAFSPLSAERLTLEVRLRRPRGFANPGGSDYVARMLREDVGATGYVRAAV